MYTNAFLLKNGVFSIIPNKTANAFIATICFTELYFAAGLMIQPHAFNATLGAEVAKGEQRTSHYEKFDYFYNPMWNWLGDREYHSGRNKLPGSFYYKTTSDVSQIYWNVFDKVIVRPQLIDAIDYSSLKILEALPMVEFILQGSKNKADNLVDHLPLTFTLNVSTK